ncbi:shikimate kinase [Thioclava litoralis]|uniref:Shikimate kinase n=1 Tax=Thioclava litoralis TaxID=3076557 RepID=A0ABZ1E1X0_9RHOB|nr:shikimate kinase [Thioclava sp. FTW29]
MTNRLERSIVLVGMMGCGKTTIGQALAQTLDVPFLDSDEAIEEAAQMSVAEIFARDGEPFFRARETEILERLLRGAPAVISTGGGAFLSEANRRVIAERGVSVWLQADLETLWHRVRLKTTRPLLKTADPKGTLRAMLEVRLPVYAQAQIHVEAGPQTDVSAMTAKVLEALHKVPDLFKTERQNG